MKPDTKNSPMAGAGRRESMGGGGGGGEKQGHL